eukprot:9374844-Alexandrium_andersonii.AAC.1
MLSPGGFPEALARPRPPSRVRSFSARGLLCEELARRNGSPTQHRLQGGFDRQHVGATCWCEHAGASMLVRACWCSSPA